MNIDDLRSEVEDDALMLPESIREVLAKATCLYSKTEVEAALDQMAAQISHKLSHSNPIFLCVVIGGIIPMGNLLPRLDFPLEVDYIHATRYHGGIIGEEVQWQVKPSINLQGRTILIIDDI